jgi:hypothetical protein
MEASSGGFMSIPGSDGAGAERRHVQLIIWRNSKAAISG